MTRGEPQKQIPENIGVFTKAGFRSGFGRIFFKSQAFSRCVQTTFGVMLAGVHSIDGANYRVPEKELAEWGLSQSLTA